MRWRPTTTCVMYVGCSRDRKSGPLNPLWFVSISFGNWAIHDWYSLVAWSPSYSIYFVCFYCYSICSCFTSVCDLPLLARKPWSYASLKLRPSDWLTRVKCGATSELKTPSLTHCIVSVLPHCISIGTRWDMNEEGRLEKGSERSIPVLYSKYAQEKVEIWIYISQPKSAFNPPSTTINLNHLWWPEYLNWFGALQVRCQAQILGPDMTLVSPAVFP